jgi:hypothetical protein
MAGCGEFAPDPGPPRAGLLHPGLSPAEVLASGGWHPRYARVLAAVSDGDYGFALVDGNGDGAELEEEFWRWEDGRWRGGSSSGAGPLDQLPPLVTGGQIEHAHAAFGRAPGRETVTVQFEQRRYVIPVSPLGVWCFIKEAAGPRPGSAHLVS